MKYLIKTLRGNELRIMNDILDDYYTYIQKNNDSLLARYYGIFTFKLRG